MRLRILAVALFTGLSVGVPIHADQRKGEFHHVTKAEGLAAAHAAASRVSTPDKFEAEFIKEMRKLSPKFDTKVLWVGPHEDLLSLQLMAVVITVEGPAQAFATRAKEHIRKMEPLVDSDWKEEGTAVSVVPIKDYAPDIIKIVVTRDGKVVEPISSTLAVPDRALLDAGHRSQHTGDVVFAPEVFEPGARVIVTAIPDHSGNIIGVFGDKELATIQ